MSYASVSRIHLHVDITISAHNCFPIFPFQSIQNSCYNLSFFLFYLNDHVSKLNFSSCDLDTYLGCLFNFANSFPVYGCLYNHVFSLHMITSLYPPLKWLIKKLPLCFLCIIRKLYSQHFQVPVSISAYFMKMIFFLIPIILDIKPLFLISMVPLLNNQ